MSSDLCRHDITVVSIGRRNKCVRLLKTSASKHIYISAIANHSVALWKVSSKAPKRVAILIDHRNAMPFAGE
jgi:hypothetical protein